MDLDLAHFAIDYAQAQGASYADARVESTKTNDFILKNGVPQMAGFDRVQGLSVRVSVNKCFGFSSTNVLSKESIRAAVDRAIKVSRAASRISEPAIMSQEDVHEAQYEVAQKKNLDDLSPNEKLQHLFDIDKSILSTGVNVPGRFLSLSDWYTEKYFASSEGAKISAKIPKTDFWYFVTIEEAGKSSQRYWQYGDAGGWETILNHDFPNLLKDEVVAMDSNMKKGIKPPKGKIDMVVAPQVTGIMVHESVGHPYEADRVMGREAAQAGETFIKEDMLSTRIGSDAVTINDDPTMPGSFGFYLYDDDGVKARKRVLIKKGMINEFLHNRSTAAAMNTHSNGSARATSFDREAIVRMANTYVETADHSEEELIEGIKHGVFMKNFTEWNIDDKRLNAKYTGAECFLIENGKLTQPVYAPIIEVSTPVLWSSIDAVGNNPEYHAGTCGKAEPMQGIPVWFGGPSMRIRGITLGNKND